MKALKVTVSGTYYYGQKERTEYHSVTGIIPAIPENFVNQQVRYRYAPMWITNDERYDKPFRKMRECYIENMEEIESDFSFVGKSIKEMNIEELQDLAVVKQLTRVPVPKHGSVFEARKIAYVEYSNKFLKTKLNDKEEGFTLMGLPDIIVDGEIDELIKRPKSAEESLNAIMSKPTLSADDLKAVLDANNVTYHHKAGFDKLYDLAIDNGLIG